MTEVDLLHKRVCSAFADSTRVLILYALAQQTLCVSDLAEALDLAQPTASRHLRVLRERGLVRADRRGTSVYYSLGDKRVIQALDLLRAVVAAQVASESELTQALAPMEDDDVEDKA